MMLATVQAEQDRNNANPEAMAVTGISIKMEFDGLVRSLTTLSTHPQIPSSKRVFKMEESST